MKKEICIIETGGTISSKTNNPSTGIYGAPNTSILNILTDNINVNLTHKNFSAKISHELTIDEIQELALEIVEILNSNIDGIVVSMGTNAIEDIAYYIGLLVNTVKPIIFTGSNFPQGSLCFDGKLNLFNAVILASSDEAKKLGVLLTFNGHVLTARHASKSLSGFIDSFNQTEGIGNIIDSRFKLRFLPNYRHTYKSEFHIQKNIKYEKVCIIYAHLGMDNSFIETIINSGAFKGIISAGFGEGYQNQKVTDLLHEATLQGITVVRCTRTGGFSANSDQSYNEKYGFLTSNGLSAQKSAILLSTALSFPMYRKNLIRIFEEY